MVKSLSKLISPSLSGLGRHVKRHGPVGCLLAEAILVLLVTFGSARQGIVAGTTLTTVPVQATGGRG